VLSAPTPTATVSAIYGIGAPEDYTQMRFIARVTDKGQRDAD
jgi:excinuclease ABC subunit B